MSPMEADCWALTMHGWGSHSRDEIPADWETRRGPDEIPHVTKSNRGKLTSPGIKRRERAAAVRLYLAGKQSQNPGVSEPTVGAIPTVQA